MTSNPKSTTLRFLLAMGLILILLAASGCGGPTPHPTAPPDPMMLPPEGTDQPTAPPDPIFLPERGKAVK